MNTVVSFWQLPDDEKEFLAFLQGTGTILALPDRWVERKEELLPQPIVPFIEEQDPHQLLFGLEEHFLGMIVEEHAVEDGTRFALPYMEPCVIAYRRGRMHNGKWGLSTLSAYLDFPSPDASKLIAKDQGFVRWAEKVMAWARRATPERIKCNGYPYRASRRMKKAVSEGEVEVALY